MLKTVTPLIKSSRFFTKTNHMGMFEPIDMEQFLHYYRTGKLFYKFGNFINARVCFLQSLAFNPISIETLCYLAMIEGSLGNVRSSLSYLNEARDKITIIAKNRSNFEYLMSFIWKSMLNININQFLPLEIIYNSGLPIEDRLNLIIHTFNLDEKNPLTWVFIGFQIFSSEFYGNNLIISDQIFENAIALDPILYNG